MAYVELTYYRDCALELREYGDAGWAVHIYAPRSTPGVGKIGVIMTTQAGDLRRVMADARRAVDAELGPMTNFDPHFQRMPVAARSSGQLLVL